MIHARFLCNQHNCNAKFREWQGDIETYQLGLHAIWFHSHHEGHEFSYWEDHVLILGDGDVPPEG